MRKIILIPAILFLSVISAFSQVLRPVKVDSLVTVSLPGTLMTRDSLGQKTLAGNGLYGYMAIIRSANEKNNAPLQKENDFNKVMKQYINTIQGESAGNTALNIRDTTVGALKAKAFTMKTMKDGGGIDYRNFVLIYTRAATYTFEYMYPDGRQSIIGDEYKQFLGSIKLSPELQRNDQYLYSATGMAPVLKFSLIGVGALALIFIITMLAKRRKLSLQ